jgi:hypothetical protein
MELNKNEQKVWQKAYDEYQKEEYTDMYNEEYTVRYREEYADLMTDDPERSQSEASAEAAKLAKETAIEVVEKEARQTADEAVAKYRLRQSRRT